MFDNYFEVLLADNDEAKQIHYNIRHQVYCEEMGFERVDNGTKLEVDDWDEHSVHFIVKAKQTGQYVGAMRLILPEKGYLPLEKHCTLNEAVIQSDLYRSVEVSRLCVVKEIRRRSTDGAPPEGITESATTALSEFLHDQRKLNRSIIWGLFRAASLYCADNHIQNWYFLTTKILHRLITKENFKMHQVGDACVLNGERYPYLIKLTQEVYQNALWSPGFQAGYKFYSEKEFISLKKCA